MSQLVREFNVNDRIGLSIFSSFLVHMVIILGVTFAIPKLREMDGLPTLEITLVQTRSDQAPKEADYLAQAHQDGGGNDELKGITRSPLPIRELGEQAHNVPRHQAMPQPLKASPEETTPLLTQDKASTRIREQQTRVQQERRVHPPAPGLTPQPALNQERARLSAEISRFWEEYQQKPKKKYINARTREYKYAAYMDAWRAKVERVGNLNYPDDARRRGLSGNLVLNVALKPDGSLQSVDVMRSSGHKLLDDAAVRIVTLAAPFSPFPKGIREEADVLHITRTWKFNPSGWRPQ